MRDFLLSFKYAYKGFIRAVQGERNLRFHLVVGCYALFLAFMLELPPDQFAILVLAVALVISLELVNSAIERSQNIIKDEYCEQIGAVKDIAAAAVLVGAICAVAVGFLLFFDPVKLMGVALVFAGNPLYILLFVISVILSIFFVFKFKGR